MTEFALALSLPPFKRRLYDAVRRAGPDGIASEDLYELLYRNRRTAKPRPIYLRVHVNQLNARLKPHGLCITGNRPRGVYLLLEVSRASHSPLSAAAPAR